MVIYQIYKQFSVVILLIILMVSCNPKSNEKLLIATAANVQFAMEELVAKFENQTQIECEIIMSSSGKLTAQIKEGAPYDIFVSANMIYPNELYNSGFTTNKPEVYAYGKLVLLSLKDDVKVDLSLLKDNSIKHIAVANPKTAPYGISASEVLHYYNIYDDVKDKLVYGESVSQTNQFILSKAAEIGFTAKSAVKSPKMVGFNNWIELPQNTYKPIEQGVVIIKNKNKTNAKANSFYKFLFSPEAKIILKKYGYEVDLKS